MFHSVSCITFGVLCANSDSKTEVTDAYLFPKVSQHWCQWIVYQSHVFADGLDHFGSDRDVRDLVLSASGWCVAVDQHIGLWNYLVACSKRKIL